MHISNLKLTNFRNIPNMKIEFDKNINIIYGNNAQGKTNILEAIYMFSYGKSFRTNRDADILKFGEDFFFIELEFEKNNRKQKIIISYDNNKNKKYIKINGANQKKLSSLIGKLNIVLFKPDDISIIKEGPSVRRRFIDMLISSIRPLYLEYLNRYNKLIEERNILLKKIYFSNNKNVKMTEEQKKLIEVYENQILDCNYKIYDYRKEYIDLLNKYILEIHKKISETNNVKEKIELKYKSKVKSKDEFKRLFENNIENDVKKGYTEYGIHRDDIIITINSLDASKYGSQGQQKSSVLSLKLAELSVIKEVTGALPILLLDDFVSELDNTRVNNIISNFENIQIIITTTDLIKVEDVSEKVYKIEAGKIIE